MERDSNPIKSEVRALRAYSLSPHRASVKLNQNENPWDAPARIKEETLRRLSKREWSRYPDFIPEALHQRLANFAGWKPQGVLAGNGSNELIQALLTVTIEKHKRVLICEPTFALYRQVTTILGGDTISVALRPDFQFDVETLLRQTEETRPDVVIICSPNNPTGSLIDEVALRRLLEISPGLVVIDEAYHEFSEQTVVPLLHDHANLIVLRTFSKAMALAAFRIGYLMAAPDLVTEFRKALLPYNLNVFSQTVAEVALEMYGTDLRPLVKTIIAERESLRRRLREIDGLEPIASRANFIIVKSRIGPKTVFNELLNHDILIRDVSAYPMLQDYFRVSVGTREENDRLISALTEIAGKPLLNHE